MSETPLNIGARAVCRACGNIIEYVGPYWQHLGAFQPRHIAMPQEGTTEDRIATLERERDALRAAVDAIATALRPALEAEAGATAGEWESHDNRITDAEMTTLFRLPTARLEEDYRNRDLVIALRNALPAVREALDKVKP